MKVMIRIANPTDASAACDVLRKSITECCVEDHHNDQTILSAWLLNKTPENVSSWFSTSSYFAVVATSDDQIIGVGLISVNGEVLLCYVTPESRFTGVGKALLRAMEQQALQWDLSSIRLNSTSAAMAFYLRNGFVQSGPSEGAFGVTTFPLSKRLSPIGG